MHYDFLFEITVVFLIASLMGLLASKFKQPAIVAYILTGLVAGPAGFGLIKNAELINQISEIGVIALLFTLGLEFSFDKFKQVQKTAIFAGVLQIVVTTFTVAGIGVLLGLGIVPSLLVGNIAALSSTVIVLKSLAEQAQTDSVHGRIMLGILVIQDLSLIPTMIILSKIGVHTGSVFVPIMFALVKATVFLGLTLALSLKIAPSIMNYVASSSKEILVLFSVSIALGTALLAGYFGISLAIGAFVAGLALSITVHSKQVVAEIVPFRDIFAMMFFVSIGMLKDTSFFIDHMGAVLGLAALVILIKFLVGFGVVYLAKYPGQTALWTGCSLFQIGEFSFVLAKVGNSSGLISNDLYSMVTIMAVITMLLTPFVVRSVPWMLTALQKSVFWNRKFRGRVRLETGTTKLDDHIIICGYGPVGQSISKILRLHSQPFVVIELNNKSIKALKKEGISAIYGDATHEDILKYAGIEKAKILIIALPDSRSCELATANARNLNEDIYIVVRARYQRDIDMLYQAGANNVIYEEYETSMAIVDNTLARLGYSCSEIESISQLVRANKCQLLKESYRNKDNRSGRMNMFLNNEVEWVRVPNHSEFVGKTLAESDFRQLTGTSIITIIKDGVTIPNPSSDSIVESGDILVALGSPQQINSLRDLIED